MNWRFSVIERLAADDSPENTFREGSYTSVTGGGWKRGVPMLFLTDSGENRRQRESVGSLIRAIGIVKPADWILNIHVSGYLYRYVIISYCNRSPDHRET